MVKGVASIPLTGRPVDGVSHRPGGDEPPVLRSFVAGSENRPLVATFQSLSGTAPCAYSPLMLMGPPGVGKSHVARGLMQSLCRQHGLEGAILTSWRDFSREMAMSLHAGQIERFRRRYRGASLLVVEEIDRIGSAHVAQQELLHTFDALTDDGRMIILTSRCAIGSIRHLHPALRSRLLSGLVLPLAPPGVAARREIVRQIAELRGLNLPDQALKTLATGLNGTVPELVSAIQKFSELLRDTSDAVGAARRYVRRPSTRTLEDMRRILAATARFFSLKQTLVRGRSRKRSVVEARRIAFYLTRDITSASFERIGRFYGGRDHATVIYNVRKIESQLPTNPALRTTVWRLKHKLDCS